MVVDCLTCFDARRSALLYNIRRQGGTARYLRASTPALNHVVHISHSNTSTLPPDNRLA